MEPDKTDLTTSVKDSKVTNSQGSFVGEQQTRKFQAQSSFLGKLMFIVSTSSEVVCLFYFLSGINFGILSSQKCLVYKFLYSNIFIVSYFHSRNSLVFFIFHFFFIISLITDWNFCIFLPSEQTFRFPVLFFFYPFYLCFFFLLVSPFQ